jgi:hypothetical protein
MNYELKSGEGAVRTGAVRTSVTLVVQYIGNTMFITGYRFDSFLTSFLRADIRPQEALRLRDNPTQQQPVKPSLLVKMSDNSYVNTLR